MDQVSVKAGEQQALHKRKKRDNQLHNHILLYSTYESTQVIRSVQVIPYVFLHKEEGTEDTVEHG